jgi:hypothetical protein
MIDGDNEIMSAFQKEIEDGIASLWRPGMTTAELSALARERLRSIASALPPVSPLDIKVERGDTPQSVKITYKPD